jgi:hypothetical protein
MKVVNLFQINLKIELIVQNLKLILPNESLLVSLLSLTFQILS